MVSLSLLHKARPVSKADALKVKVHIIQPFCSVIPEVRFIK